MSPVPSKPDASARPPSAAAPNKPWVPIRSLGPRHRARIAAHLLSLNLDDRFLRFGYPATDAQIARYVDTLNFKRDEVFGIFSRRLELIAMAHLAHAVATPAHEGKAVSEFGVSVMPHARARGYGGRLFEHAMLHARNRGVETLFIHALSQNTAMLKIARRAGGTVVRDGSESDAWVDLPPDSLGSHVDELMVQQAAEIDYGFKRRLRQLGGLLVSLRLTKNRPGKPVRRGDK